MLKDSYTTKEGSVFPGTERDYQIYLPAGLDKTKPAAFMVFQDGVIYQAPVVFDNLIAKQDIPPLVGIFIKPGVVPAANDNALPRFNRSYEYDSITPTYSQFLIDEFLPAIETKHGLKLSTDPNHAAISGNSSGGICAFMAAWHRPDRFRRVFTGVGTYVGIHGADQLPVLVRKFEPKPLRVFLQSGTGDNNLYCGDWWMANQMMERSLTWAGYDVNHAWGEGGHNAKHASQIFPDVLRWLWRDWQADIEVKANPKGESKWKGYEVVGDGEWLPAWERRTERRGDYLVRLDSDAKYFAVNVKGDVFASAYNSGGDVVPYPRLIKVPAGKSGFVFKELKFIPNGLAFGPDGRLYVTVAERQSESILEDVKIVAFDDSGNEEPALTSSVQNPVIKPAMICFDNTGHFICFDAYKDVYWGSATPRMFVLETFRPNADKTEWPGSRAVFSPDQTQFYTTRPDYPFRPNSRFVSCFQTQSGSPVKFGQQYCMLDSLFDRDFELSDIEGGGLCVDTNGWLYVATALGIQVCDQAGRVNFILPTPKQPYDVCFGGKDLNELFIACGDTIYKRPTKAKGVVSGQQPPIKPTPPKL
jgi:enterochelin esterase-like enzyme